MTTDAMLSRIAESLFWLGRYVERADDTARILDAYLHRLLEDPWRDENTACRSLHAILGVVPWPGRPCDMDAVLDRLAFDSSDLTSIGGALRAARENALRAREVVSTEVWECLNSTWHQLGAQQLAARRTGPHAYLALVRRRAALLSGLVDSTMSRDDGWRFVVLGRSLERVDMTARLLAVRVLDAAHAPDWPTLLTASGADEAFLRSRAAPGHGGVGSASGAMGDAAGFLLLDRDFPRSVLHALTTAEECVTALGSADALGRPDPLRLPIGRMRTRLEFLDAREPVDLPTLLIDLQRSCGEASEAVSERFFPYDGPLTWELEGA